MLRRRACHPLFLALLPLLLSIAPLAADEAPLTAEMLVDLHSVREVAVSPDGERVAYTLDVPRGAGDEPGSSYRELWMLDFDKPRLDKPRLDKKRTRRYTPERERVSSPTFTPDGKYVAFLVRRAEVDEQTQVYQMRVRGGEARPLTRHQSSVSAFRFSPDGRWVAYLAADAETEAEKAAIKEGRDWQVHDTDPAWTRLWIQDVKRNEHRLVLDDDLDIKDLIWTPRGDALVIRATPTTRVDDDMMRGRLYAVRLTDKPEDAVARPLADTPGKLGDIALSPDGRRLAWLGAVSTNDPLAQSVWVLDLDESLEPVGAPRNLSEGYVGSVARIAFLDDETLLALAVEGSRHVLHRIDAASGERHPVDGSRRIIADWHVEPSAGLVAFAAHAPEHPRELYVAKLGDGDGNGGELAAAERLTDSNPELGGVRLARQEIIEWKGPDGLRIEGILTHPLDGDGDGDGDDSPAPLILQVHGGPEGVSLDGWTSSATYPVQILAARGFAVLQPNYRASQGRGVNFSKADHDDLGGLEFDDILAGIDHLAERGLIDPQRVGTGGWSYGGFLSAWAATRHAERFKAAVMGAGISNWISFAGTTDIPREMSLVHWNNWWWDRPTLQWERSPVAHADQDSAPTLILHGLRDTRVHPEQSLQMYTTLRLRGVPTTLVEYPREPHGLNERAHQLDAIGRVVEWFERYVKGPQVGRVDERRD